MSDAPQYPLYQYLDRDFWERVEYELIDGCFKVVHECPFEALRFDDLPLGLNVFVLQNHSLPPFENLVVFQDFVHAVEFNRLIEDPNWREQFMDDGWYCYCMTDVRDRSQMLPTLAAELYVEPGYRKFPPALDFEAISQANQETPTPEPAPKLGLPTIAILTPQTQSKVYLCEGDAVVLKGEASFLQAVTLAYNGPSSGVVEDVVVEGEMPDYRTWQGRINGLKAGCYHIKAMDSSNDQVVASITLDVIDTTYCIPVIPKWRQTLGYDQAFALVACLPTELRYAVYHGLLQHYSPLLQAQAKGKNPADIATLGMAYERDMALPFDFDQWKSVIKTQDPALWQRVQKALQLVEVPDLSEGWLLIYYQRPQDSHFYLWREYQVLPQKHGNRFREVQLNLFAYQNRRYAEGATSDFVPIPVEIDGQAVEVLCCFSQQQWSWPRIHAMGGMDPNDRRLSVSLLHSQANFMHQALQKNKPNPALCQSRFGGVIPTQDWFDPEAEPIVDSSRILPKGNITLMPKRQQLSQSDLESQSVHTQASYALFSSPTKVYPVLLLDDPIGMASKMASDIAELWHDFSHFIHKRLPHEPSYCDVDPQQNYFASAALANQLCFNTRMDGLTRKVVDKVVLLTTEQELLVKDPLKTVLGPAMQDSVDVSYLGQAVAFQKAGELLDENKLHWLLRKKHRALQRFIIRQCQITLVDLLEAQAKDQWSVDINSALRDTFAVGPTCGYTSLWGLMAYACKDPHEIDRSLDVDPRYVNQVSFQEIMQTSPRDGHLQLVTRQRTQETQYLAVPYGWLECQRNFVTQETEYRRIANVLPPGLQYFDRLHQEGHPLFDCLFPTTETKDHAVYLQGNGTFWPLGFKLFWQGQNVDVDHVTIRDVADKATHTLSNVISNYMLMAGTEWREHPLHQGQNKRQLYFKLLAEAEPQFKNRQIITSRGKQHYKLLLSEYEADENTQQTHEKDAVFAALDHNGKLQFRETEAEADAIVKGQAEASPTIKALKGKLMMTYVNDDLKISKILNPATKALSKVLAALAIWDVFTQINSVGQDPKDWTNWGHLLVAFEGLVNEVTECIELIKPEQEQVEDMMAHVADHELTLMEKLGIYAMGLNCALSFTALCRAVRSGDPVQMRAAGVQVVGNVSYLGGKMAKILPPSRILKRISFANSDSEPVLATDTADSTLVEEIAALGVPGIDVFDFILLGCTFASIVISTFEDTPFESWARTSPFAKKVVDAVVKNKKQLDQTLFGLVFMPQIITSPIEPQSHLSDGGWKLTTRLLQPTLDITGSLECQLQYCWQIREGECAKGDHFPNPSQSAKLESPVRQASQPVIILPQKRKIGCQHREVFTLDTLIEMNRKLVSNFRWDRNLEADFIGEQTYEFVRFLSRGKIIADQVTLPLASQEVPIIKNEKAHGHVGDDAFESNPNYVHSVNTINYQLSQPLIEFINHKLINE